MEIMVNNMNEEIKEIEIEFENWLIKEMGFQLKGDE